MTPTNNIYRKNAGYHKCSIGFCERSGDIMYYHGGSDGILDGYHGNCIQSRDH